MQMDVLKPIPLLLVFVWGCAGSPNKSIIGEWSGVDEPASKLVVTEREMIFKTKKGAETKQYEMVSADEIVFSPEGKGGARVTCKVEVTPSSLTLRLPDGTKTFTKKAE